MGVQASQSASGAEAVSCVFRVPCSWADTNKPRADSREKRVTAERRDSTATVDFSWFSGEATVAVAVAVGGRSQVCAAADSHARLHA